MGVVRHAAQNRVEELLRQRAVVECGDGVLRQRPQQSAAIAAPPDWRDLTQSLVCSSDALSRTRTPRLERVNARFDEELVRLKQLWSVQTRPPAKDALRR